MRLPSLKNTLYPNITVHEQRAMRELQVQGLPPDTEPARITQVLSLIRKQLTTFRAVIKEKVPFVLPILIWGIHPHD